MDSTHFPVLFLFFSTQWAATAINLAQCVALEFSASSPNYIQTFRTAKQASVQYGQELAQFGRDMDAAIDAG